MKDIKHIKKWVGNLILARGSRDCERPPHMLQARSNSPFISNQLGYISFLSILNARPWDRRQQQWEQFLHRSPPGWWRSLQGSQQHNCSQDQDFTVEADFEMPWNIYLLSTVSEETETARKKIENIMLSSATTSHLNVHSDRHVF